MMRTFRVSIRTAVALPLAAALAYGGDPLRLRQVLDAATAKSQRETSNQSVAEAQLQLLRSLDRVKVDLRPQAGIFSFSQPSLIATSFGAGVVVSHRTAPGPSAIESGELDVVAAQIARKRAKLRAEIESARVFFDLLGKQENSRRVCESLQDSKRRQVDVARLVKSAKLTAVDMVRFDEQMLDQQLECIDAETQRKLVSVQLATLTGATDLISELRVEDVALPVPGAERPIPAPDKLFDLAMAFRPEPKVIQEQIASVKPKADPIASLRPDTVSMGYYRVQENHNLAGTAGPNYLLGGNTVRADATWNIALRKTGDQVAAADLVAAKVHNLESQLNALREDIRNELAAVYVLAAASLEKVPVAGQRLELVTRGRGLMAARFQSGLAPSAGVFEAEQQALRAQSGLTQATCDLKASTFIMLALAGIEDKPLAEQDRLLGYSQASARTPLQPRQLPDKP